MSIFSHSIPLSMAPEKGKIPKKEEKKWGGKRLEQREHILLRPHIPMGNVYLEKRIDYIVEGAEPENSEKIKEIKIKPDDESDIKIGKMFIPTESDYDYNNLLTIPDQIKIKEVEILGNPALENMISECMFNIQDNVVRSEEAGEKTTRIEVEIKPNGFVRLWNNGQTIPIELFEDKDEKDLYAPEAAFARFMVSTNFDDDEDRNLLGQNGFGVKLTTLMSTKATLRTYDKNSKQYYEQTWRDNLNLELPRERLVTKDKKIISEKCSDLEKKGFTEISFLPDFKRFNHNKKSNPDGMKNFTRDIIGIIKRHCVDMAMITKVPVYFNGKPIKIKNLVEYSKLFIEESMEAFISDKEEKDEDELKFSDSVDTFIEIKTKNSNVILRPSSKYKYIAFTNGGHNHMGGVHVDSWIEALLRPIVEKINGKGVKTKVVAKTKVKAKAKAKTKEEKKFKVTINHIKKHFMIFIVCKDIINPKFPDQVKSKLVFPPIDTEVKAKDINKIMKWDFVTKISNYMKLKELLDMKKVIGTGKKANPSVMGLDKANLAGKSEQSLLILCEGKSAKQTALAGIASGILGVKGRDYIGVMALLGKLLNCKKASASALKKNKVVIGIIRAVGIEMDVDYSKKNNRKKLMYQRVGIMTDADVDGIHIRALIVNLFYFFAPSLIEEGDFLYNINTPIISIIKKGKNPLYFYNQENARKYIKDNNIPKKTIKYYKGLGTWLSKSIPDIFSANVVSYNKDKDADSNLDGAFSDKTTLRKVWISEYKPLKELSDESGKEYLNTEAVKEYNISDLIRKDLILFFIDVCNRMIPNVFDGNMESRRKILHTFFKLKMNYNKPTQKVEIISGKVSEISSYHHGDGNLDDTIARMAQDWPGTNNVNLLYPDGQFGGQDQGRDSAASGRYIFSKLEKLTRLIFREEDEDILIKQEDDGKGIEPEYFLPIVNMYLVNTGKSNIAVGYSSNVPPHDLLDIINYQKAWLKNKYYILSDGNIILIDLPELTPSYRGFKGTIKKTPTGNFLVEGIMKKIKTNVYQITEIPPDKSIENIRTKLNKLIDEKEIKNYKDNCGEDPNLLINITVTVIDENKFNKKSGVTLKSMGLVSTLHTTNMVGIVDDNKVVKFSNVDDIMDIYLNKRYQGYKDRKIFQMNRLSIDIKWLKNKVRYIECLLPDCNKKEKITIENDEKKVIKLLEERKFDKKTEDRKKNEDDEELGDVEEEKGSFNYLLNMPIRSQTSTRLEKLKKELEELEKKLNNLDEKKEADIWMEELEELTVEYKKWLKEKEKATIEQFGGKKKRPTSKKKSK